MKKLTNRKDFLMKRILLGIILILMTTSCSLHQDDCRSGYCGLNPEKIGQLGIGYTLEGCSAISTSLGHFELDELIVGAAFYYTHEAGQDQFVHEIIFQLIPCGDDQDIIHLLCYSVRKNNTVKEFLFFTAFSTEDYELFKRAVQMYGKYRYEYL